MAIKGKIHWEDFSLTNNCKNVQEVKKQFGIDVDSRGMIEIIIGFDGNPYEEYKIINNGKDISCDGKTSTGVVDIYCPTQKDIRKKGDNGIGGMENDRFESMPVLTDNIKGFKKFNHNQN